MPFMCTLPSGKSYHLDELPLIVVEEIARKAEIAPASWYLILDNPRLYPKAAVALMQECARRLGDPEPLPEYLTFKTMVTTFTEYKGDDRPVEYEDGVPKVEAAEVTPG